MITSQERRGLPGMNRSPTSTRRPKPENLAGYKHQEQGKEDQLETAELVGTCDQERNTSKDQQQNDRAPVNDDAAVDCDKSAADLADFRCLTRWSHVLINSNTVTSGRAPMRMGGPVVPMPRLT